METLQRKYNTDPLGNAFILVTDAKKAVTQIDLFSGPELFRSMVTSDRQNFADTSSYVTYMLDIRNKLANTADDFKVTDRLFAWTLILGYRNTDRRLADEMENDVSRGAKTPQDIISQLQHLGDREKVLTSTTNYKSSCSSSSGASSPIHEN
jgi:hypothetical protein